MMTNFPRRFESLYSISIEVEQCLPGCGQRGIGSAGGECPLATVWRPPQSLDGGTGVDMGGWYQNAPPSVRPLRTPWSRRATNARSVSIAGWYDSAVPEFKFVAPFEPTGDQPQAIERLTDGLTNGLEHQVL